MSNPLPRAPGVNPNASQIQQPVANLGALVNVAQTLKQNVDSLTGMRGSLTDRAVTFNDLVNLGLVSAAALASTTPGLTNFVTGTQVIENVNVIGPGIFKSGGAVGVQWNAGVVNALGSHLHIAGDTLDVQNVVTTVVAGSGITVTGTTSPTIKADWRAGLVNTVGPGLLLYGGSLRAYWVAGSVTSIGTGLDLTSGVLSATATGMAPLVTGELDADGGPKLIADPDGQCVMVPL